MCDTLAIRQNGIIYFAKNSDREPGEAQLVVRIPPVKADHRKKLKATYIEIDQVQRRHGVILSKPFWMFGAEMGANDRGVVIGNEAVFTRVMEKENGLIGMDLLRLGLERGDTAEHAMRVIIELIETCGQGGICGFRDKRLRYDNSFIIADSNQIWILETAGRQWVAKKTESFGAISNCLTITDDYDIKSHGLEDFARQKGLFSGGGELNFKKTFDSWFLPYFARSAQRLNLSLQCLSGIETGQKRVLHEMMNSLRRHQDENTAPIKGSNADVCMHAGGLIRRSQTCGSMVSRLEKNNPLHFFTGTSAPCLSIFKPVSFDMDLNFSVLNSDENTVDGSLWQRHEHAHRRLLFLGKERKQVRDSIRDAENGMFKIFEAKNYFIEPDDIKAADQIVSDLEEEFVKQYTNREIQHPMLSPYGLYWKWVNRLDGFR
jgi:dipeptidase